MSILGEETVTLRRTTTALVVGSDGRPSTPTTADTSIKMSYQPMGEQEMQNLPEGQRQRDPHKGYTETALRTVDQAGDLYADKIVVDSVVFQIQSVTRQRKLIPHWRAIMLRVQETT